MSATTFKQTLDRWLFGERFYLRSPLAEEECKRRIAQYGAELIPSLTNDYSACCVGNRVVVAMQLDRTAQFLRRTPSLVGKMRSTGSGTEIVGRSGGDLITLWASIGMEVLLLLYVLVFAPEDPALLLVLLLPVVSFILTRRSADGEELIDFLQQILEAEDVLSRAGDPTVRV